MGHGGYWCYTGGRVVLGGGWSDNLDAAVESYNEQLNRTGGMAPAEPVKLDKYAQKQYRDHIIENNDARATDFMVRRPLEAGTRMRLKLAKSKLDAACASTTAMLLYVFATAGCSEPSVFSMLARTLR